MEEKAVHYPAQIYSELELMVIEDMYKNGYDFMNPEDVKKFWEERLPK